MCGNGAMTFTKWTITRSLPERIRAGPQRGKPKSCAAGPGALSPKVVALVTGIMRIPGMLMFVLATTFMDSGAFAKSRVHEHKAKDRFVWHRLGDLLAAV